MKQYNWPQKATPSLHLDIKQVFKKPITPITDQSAKSPAMTLKVGQGILGTF